MSTAISNPLQSLLLQAAKQMPSGEMGKVQRRMINATDAVIVLADVSDSMGEKVGAKRKIDILQSALTQVWPTLPTGRLIAFSSVPEFLADPSSLPSPSGSTALHFALQAAEGFRPRQTLVISDGRPDSEDAALEVADRITGRIDVIYCGRDEDTQAIAFLQRLARLSGGRCIVTPNGTKTLNLLQSVRRLLLLPEAR